VDQEGRAPGVLLLFIAFAAGGVNYHSIPRCRQRRVLDRHALAGWLEQGPIAALVKGSALAVPMGIGE